MDTEHGSSENNMGASTAAVVNNSNKKDPVIHYLPCTIKYDGPALIGSYFEVKDSKTNNNCVESQFRGRHLVGQLSNVPENCTGVVFCKKQFNQGIVSPSKESTAVVAALPAQEIRSTFKDIYIWEHDVFNAGNGGDGGNAVMSEIVDMIDIAHSIHDI